MVIIPMRVVMAVMMMPVPVNMHRRRNDPTHRHWMDDDRRRTHYCGRVMMVIVPQRNAEAEPIRAGIQGGETQAG